MGLAGCASRPVMQDGILINDPYEAQNRRVHAFNKALDAKIVGPVSDLALSDDEPAPAGTDAGGIKPLDLVINIGSNLSLPGKAVNSLLQGRPGPAAKNISRFAVNSTLGIAGLLDPAGSHMGLTEVDTDFGETLAVWGVPEGAYLELPVLGPSTQRDSFGKGVDVLIDPFGLVLDWWPGRAVEYTLRIASKAGERARFGDTVDSVLQDSADSYAQTRLIYLMHRRHDVGEEGAEFDPYDDPYAEPGQEAGFIDPYAAE
ncbi:VacJ family lipoprotein [Paracoccus sp. XHP0099]|uniref:VacJ family lipoprotein n=2 Tax=Paracoccus marinaquae TaxID=2841926 RepID=A0ABS6AHP6_9RHOB|nr:VacJ family lipoprotein [Paracoccus marinaquae]